jgi:hypothetical protein
MKAQTQTLARISTAKLKKFLTELANLRDDLDSTRRFERAFAAFIPSFHRTSLFDQTQIEEDEQLKRTFTPTLQDRVIENFGAHFWMLPSLQMVVCRLWIEPDVRQREWAAFIIRYHLYTVAQDQSSEVDFLDTSSDRIPRIPPPTPFEQALVYLVKFADKARYCANPECPAPYFFAERKNQKYCSEICAAPAQRELKRQWWAEHGEEWRTARKKAESSKRSKGSLKRNEKTKARKKGR